VAANVYSVYFLCSDFSSQYFRIFFVSMPFRPIDSLDLVLAWPLWQMISVGECRDDEISERNDSMRVSTSSGEPRELDLLFSGKVNYCYSVSASKQYRVRY